ncbi:Methyltransferase-like protein 2-A [Porites harrisoni]
MADSEDSSRPQFGNRFLSDPSKVFEHNAWDSVEWDTEQEEAAQQKINENSRVKLGEDQQKLYEEKADCFWNEFYMQHQNRFFKDRHWLFTEFPELSGPNSLKPQPEHEQTTTFLASRYEEALRSKTSSDDTPLQQETNLQAVKNNEASSPHSVNPQHLEKTNLQAIGHERDLTKETHLSDFLENLNVSNSSKNVAANSSTMGDGCKEFDNTLCCASVKQNLSTTILKDNGTESERRYIEVYPGHKKKKQILEVGCGVGNTVFPILEANNDPDLFVYCCDFSSNAINLVKEHPDFSTERCHAFVYDVTDSTFVFPFPDGSLDIVILIFVLSAVHPDKMQDVIYRLSKLLKPGGLILFRDYGRFDMAQLRFKKGKCLAENFYVRGDGTRVYFFTQDDLSRMFKQAGLVEEQNYVDRRLQVNRGRQLKMYRIWIQCKYRKPT